MDFYVSVVGSAWEVLLLEDGKSKELVYATFQGPIHCLDLGSMQHSWTLPGEDFPFALARTQREPGSRDLVLVATAAGELIAIDAGGAVQWKFCSPYPMYDVAPGKFRKEETLIACGGIESTLHVLDTDGCTVCERPLERFGHRMVAGDFDGDGLDELLLMDGRGGAVMLKLRGTQFDVLWDHPIQLPEEYANWENWSAQLKPMDLHATDIDGDGREEIVMGDSFHNHQTVVALSGDGTLRWASEPLSWYAKDRTWFEYFSTALVTTVPSHTGDGTREIATVAGGLVRLFSCDGELLGEAESGLGFAGVVADGRTLYLGSTPNGDDTVYCVDLSPGWEQKVSSLEVRGLAGQIRRTLGEIREQALQHPGNAQTRSPYQVRQFSVPTGDVSSESYQELVGSFRQQVPEPVFRNVVGMGVLEDEPVLKRDGTPFNLVRFNIDSPRGTSSPDEIVELVRRIESARIPTVFNVGHNCSPKVTLRTAERMLEAGREYLVGFQTAEDVSAELIGDYVEQFIGPLCDLCLEHGGKQVVIKNKVLWWLDGPADRDVYENLFGTPRREVLVATTEESNARWSETNLMGRLGLYYAGLVGKMSVGVIRDMFAPNRFHEREYPRSGHPFLRMLIAHTVTGCSIFRFAISDKITGLGKQVQYNLLGRESTELFLHLLGKGIVFPPRPEQMANICPVGLVMHPPPEKWLRNAHNNHRPWEAHEDGGTLNAVYPRLHCGWGHAPLPEHAFARVAFRKKRVFDGMVPATPYGHLLMLPCHHDRTGIGVVEEWWHTDGICLWRNDGPRLAGPAAGQELTESLKTASSSLPLQSVGQDVFYQLLRVGQDTYRLIVVDPGWLDPADRGSEFAINLPGNWTAHDILRREAVPVVDRKLRLTVPAGAFRVLDLRRGLQGDG
jgi:hypothetical protein